MRALLAGLVALAWMTSAILPCSAARAASTEVFLRTGDVMGDGATLGWWSDPAVSPRGDIAFIGTASALLLTGGDSIEAVAAAGDPLPAPLRGKFRGFTRVAVNESGVLVFGADVDSPDAEGGVFRYADGELDVISLEAYRMVAISAGGMIAYGTSRGVHLWDPTTRESRVIVQGRVRGPAPAVNDAGVVVEGRVGGPALAVNDAGVVVFIMRPRGSTDGIYAFMPGNGLVRVAADGEPSPAGEPYKKLRLSARYPLSINNRSEIAFSAILKKSKSMAAIVHDLATGETRLIAQGKRTAAIGIDSGGNVAFVAGSTLNLKSGGVTTVLAQDVPAVAHFAPVLTDSGLLAWADGLAIRRYDGEIASLHEPGDETPIGPYVMPDKVALSGKGRVAFVARRSVLYRGREGEIPQPVAAPGDRSPGEGVLLDFAAHEFLGGTLFFLASDERGLILIASRRNQLIRVAAGGDASPAGGVLTLSRLSYCDHPRLNCSLDAAGDHLVFADEVYTVDDMLSGGIFSVNLRTRKLSFLAAVGDPGPAGTVIGSFGTVLARPGEATFSASARCPSKDENGMEDAPDSRCVSGERIVSLRRGRPLTLMAEGGRAPGGNRFQRLLSMRRGRKGVVFAATVVPGDAPCGPDDWSSECLELSSTGLFMATPGKRPRKIVQTGDRANRNGTRIMLDQDPVYAVRGNTVVWQAAIESKSSDIERQAAFFVSRHRSRGKRRLVGAEEEIRYGLTLSDLEPRVALSGKAIAFVGISGVSGDPGPFVEGIHLRRGARVVALARVGDPTPLGGVIADLIGPISIFGNTVVYRAILDDTETTEALLVSHP